MSFSESQLKKMMKDVLNEDKPKQSQVDHVCGCPDCYCGVLKKARETFKYQCEDCDLPLPDGMVTREDLSCPFCGGSKAKLIEREVV